MAQQERDKQEKAWENRLRRVAVRRGYRLIRCGRRDPKAVGFGTYLICDDTGRIVAGDAIKYGLSLDDAERFLDDPLAAPDLTTRNAGRPRRQERQASR